MEECPICLENTKTDSYINGCSHEFCFYCISKWAVNNRAQCPMCNQPIFGLVSDELYLSPHYGQFGITYKRSFNNQLQVESIVANSIASTHGIKEGDHLYVNGYTAFEQCNRSIKEAKKMGRMIHVKAIHSPRPQNMFFEDCCLWRLWRAKTMP